MSQAQWRIIESNSAASLAFLTWEVLITYSDEVEYIWSKPAKSWTKWAFLISRYPLLVSQILFQLNRLPTNAVHSQHDCKSWFIWGAFTSRAASTSMEIIQMIRVYALYNRTVKITVILVSLLLFEVVLATVSVVLSVEDLSFNACRPIDEGRPLLYFYGAILLNQVVILALTLFKYICDHRAGVRKMDILTLMMRDGTIAFLLVSAIALLGVIVSIAYPSIILIGFGWFLSATSSASCRLMINLERFAEARVQVEVNGNCTPIEFTTEFQGVDDTLDSSMGPEIEAMPKRY